MNQRTNSKYTFLSRFWLRFMLFNSISCIGVLSLFSGNLVLAQTESAIDPVIFTSSQNSQSSTVTTPRASSSNPTTIRWQRLRQRLKSPSVGQQKRILKRQQYSNTVPSRQATQPQVSMRSVAPQNTQNNLSRSQQQRSTKSLVTSNYDGAFIDPTEYKIGATTGYEAPKSVVLSERATGCKALARPGLSGSICSNAVQRSMRVAQLVRSSRTNTFVGRGIRPIQVGPISISANGFRVSNNPKTNRSILSYYRDFLPKAGVNANFMYPLTIPAPITSLFGWRMHPITGNLRFHAGTDLGAPLGTPVLAAYAGTVEVADYLGGYGLAVVLNHNKATLQTLYGHLSEIFVEPGEKVAQGTVIGRVGSTGNSTGPHLHFETRQLTPQGWVATDSGAQLEYAFAQLMKALQTAQAKQKPNDRV